MSDAEHSLSMDHRFVSLMWRLKCSNPGPQRNKELEQFRKQIYEDYPSHDEGLVLKSFTLNDFLQARDELYKLDHPMKVPNTSSWGFPWVRRSSAVTDGPTSLSGSVVGSWSTPGLGLTDTCATSGRPSQT
jgi:hypothetical protein